MIAGQAKLLHLPHMIEQIEVLSLGPGHWWLSGARCVKQNDCSQIEQRNGMSVFFWHLANLQPDIGGAETRCFEHFDMACSAKFFCSSSPLLTRTCCLQIGQKSTFLSGWEQDPWFDRCWRQKIPPQREHLKGKKSFCLQSERWQWAPTSESSIKNRMTPRNDKKIETSIFNYQACCIAASCMQPTHATMQVPACRGWSAVRGIESIIKNVKKTKTFIKNKSQWVCFFSSLWSVFAVLPSSAKRNWSEWNIWKVSCFRTSPSCGEPISTFRPTLHFPPRFFCQEQIVFSVGLLFFSFFFFCLFFFFSATSFWFRLFLWVRTLCFSRSSFYRQEHCGKQGLVVRIFDGTFSFCFCQPSALWCRFELWQICSIAWQNVWWRICCSHSSFDSSSGWFAFSFVGLLFLLLDFFFLWNWLLFFNRTLWMLLLWAGLRRLSSRNPTSRHQVASLFFLFSFLLNTGYSFLSVTIENELRLPSFVENSELNKQVCLLFLFFFFFFVLVC